MKRETGYYWVKPSIEHACQVAFYSDTTGKWSTLSASLLPALVDDDEFFNINETRILNPSEK